MNKRYIKPSIKVMTLNMSTMLCSSDKTTKESVEWNAPGVEGGNAFAKPYSVWGDDELEE